MTSANSTGLLETLRDMDRDRYLACLLSPVEKRGALAAIYAFNAELARIRDIVREPLPGEVRMQYWRDLLEGVSHGSRSANPLAAALIETIEGFSLPRQTFVDMIEARLFDLYDDPMESRTALEGYAGETASAVIQLACLVLDPDGARAVSDAAGHAGVAQTVAGLLMLMPLHRHRGQLYIPAEILSATGLDRETFLAGADRPRISAAIDAFAGFGRDHLTKAKAASRAVSPAAFSAFLPVVMAGPVLNAAAKAGAGLFDRPIQPAQWRRQWWMARAQFLKRL